MKIAFVDVATNSFEAFELASGIAEQLLSDVYLVHFTSPDLLKIPASCARVLSEGADSAIVFAMVSASQARETDLVHEKIIDVEIHSGKFVFTTFLFEDEWRTEGRLKQVAEQKIHAMLEMALGMKGAAVTPPSEALPSETSPAMGMFSLPTETTPESPMEGPSSGDSRPLF